MSFFADIAAEMKDLIYNSDNDMSEQIEWHPLGVEGNKRTIWAVVIRPDSQQNGNVQAPALLIHCLNDSTDGVSSDEIDIGADLWKFPDRVGGTATTHPAKTLNSHDDAELVISF